MEVDEGVGRAAESEEAMTGYWRVEMDCNIEAPVFACQFIVYSTCRCRTRLDDGRDGSAVVSTV